MTSVQPMRAEDYIEATGAALPVAKAREYAVKLAACPAWSAFVNGKLAGCAGLAPLWSGVAEAWLAVTPLGRQHPVVVYRSAIRVLRSAIKAQKLKRVQADVIAGFDTGHEFVKRLGFSRESLMPKYGPKGEDFVRYAMFPGDSE